MNMTRKQILVIGGGAAGMMAALSAAENGASVQLLERNEKLGKKVYITGKGRCNLTNTAEGEEFMHNIVHNPRFLYASFACLNNTALMQKIEALGVPLKVERGGRVFPVSDHASDITNALLRELRRLGVQILLDSRVSSILTEENRVCCVQLEDGRILHGDSVILATGGVSYPSTGSTGDGYDFARRLGHTIEEPRTSLVPIETKESWPANLTGLSLKNVSLKAWVPQKNRSKLLFDEQGEMLFTHFGISGPLVLSLSSLLPSDLSGVQMSIDLKPALDLQTLEARLLRDFTEASRKQITYVMDGLTPHNLGQQILLLAGINPQTSVNSITREQRQKILSLLKGLPLTPKKLRGFEEAIITRGGVCIKEINPSTLESRLVSGLYFAGEVIDVDAQTGGFNLQIAFSTGMLSGKSAANGGNVL